MRWSDCSPSPSTGPAKYGAGLRCGGVELVKLLFETELLELLELLLDGERLRFAMIERIKNTLTPN